MTESSSSGNRPRKGQHAEGPRPLPDQYAWAWRRACDSLSVLDRQFSADRGSAAVRFAELERQPWARRFLLVDNSPRFRTLGIAEAALAASQSAWAEDTHESERYAELALAVLAHIPPCSSQLALINDYRARAWSHLANARRIRAEFPAAREAFRRAEAFLQSGTGDAGELARMLDLRASLARASRHFAEAESLLRRVVRIHREVGDEHLAGRGLVSLAILRFTLGEPAEALELVESAARRIDPERDPRLRFQVEMNHALFLSALGRTAEARARLPEVRRLAKVLGTRLDHLRLLWVSALLHRDRGRVELAEQALHRVRDGFAAEARPFEAALAALDLAVLYLATGRLEATATLARETAALLAALDVQPDLLAALAVFHQAAERQLASVALVEDLAREVRRRGSAVEPLGLPWRDDCGRR